LKNSFHVKFFRYFEFSRKKILYKVLYLPKVNKKKEKLTKTSFLKVFGENINIFDAILHIAAILSFHDSQNFFSIEQCMKYNISKN
jgi:hypothetical protein